MKSSGVPPEDGDSDLSMSPRDAEVVGAIEDQGLSTFTFDGLRRIMGVHPETLSRSLERLEEDGIVVKYPGGYSVTSKMKSASALRPALSGEMRVPILHTFLPYGVGAGVVVSALKGRWFDTMRWVGMAEGEEGGLGGAGDVYDVRQHSACAKTRERNYSACNPVPG